MHQAAGAVEEAAGVPLLHIADPTADAMVAGGHTRVGLLATRFTMEQDFYVGRLRERGLDVVVPDATDREVVHRVIYDELVHDVVRPESREAYLGVVDRLVAAGAEAVVLGCTEIGLLLRDGDAAVPLYDTTALHVAAGVDWLCAD
ncbi:aspartate/glutamate racemase family protein [Oryzobacter telluris]|uniref:aspartate/glutamate racemase family protein n=1 Tax=Oryzobacter telluris TaxID=3149179 RepID=UPI00370D2D28